MRRSAAANELYQSHATAHESDIHSFFRTALTDFPFTIDSDDLHQQRSIVFQQHSQEFLPRIIDALRQHNLEQLQVYLGPSLYLMQHCYQQNFLANYPAWLSAKSKADFDNTVFYTVMWFCRFHDYQILWQQFARTQSATKKYQAILPLYQQAMEIYTTQGLYAYAKFMQQHPDIERMKQDPATLERLWQQYEKNLTAKNREKLVLLSPLYHEAMDIYKREGLSAYTAFMKKKSTADLFKIVDAKALWCFLVDLYKQSPLQEKTLNKAESAQLMSILRQEVAHPQIPYQPAALSAQPADEEKLDHYQLADRESLSASRELVVATPRHVGFDSADDNEEQSRAFVPPNLSWQQQINHVRQQHQRDHTSQINRWLNEVSNIITTTKGHLPSLLYYCRQQSEVDISSCAGIHETQRVAFERYKENRDKTLRDYRIFARAWLNENCKHIPHPAKESLITAIIDSGVGMMPLDAPELRSQANSNTVFNLSLLHIAMYEYEQSRFRHGPKHDTTIRCSKIVVHLIERGALLSVVNSQSKTPLEYAEILPHEMPKEWSKAIKRAMSEPASTVPAQQAQELLCNEIYYVTDWFWGIFYNHREIDAVVAAVISGQITLRLVHLPQIASRDLKPMLIAGRGIFKPQPQLPSSPAGLEMLTVVGRTGTASRTETDRLLADEAQSSYS
jgi:hypothetical protein